MGLLLVVFDQMMMILLGNHLTSYRFFFSPYCLPSLIDVSTDCYTEPIINDGNDFVRIRSFCVSYVDKKIFKYNWNDHQLRSTVYRRLPVRSLVFFHTNYTIFVVCIIEAWRTSHGRIAIWESIPFVCDYFIHVNLLTHISHTRTKSFG